MVCGDVLFYDNRAVPARALWFPRCGEFSSFGNVVCVPLSAFQRLVCLKSGLGVSLPLTFLLAPCSGYVSCCWLSPYFVCLC
jgi:hypothetical protein